MLYRNRSMLGVTLLEIMLVLAIAGMIIVMSVRYYQTASSSSQANAITQQVQAIIAAEEAYLQSNGTYGSSTQVAPLLPTNALATPWNTTITLTATSGQLSITIPGMPTQVCALVDGRLKANSRITGGGLPACSTAYVYQ